MRLALLLACIFAAGSATMIPKKIVKMYAQKKIYESCFGKEVMRTLFMEVMGAVDRCKGEGMDNSIVMDEYLPPIMNNVRRAQRPYMPMRSYVVPVVPQFYYGHTHHHQEKRSLPPPEKVQMILEKVRSKVSNITCVLRDLKMLTPDNQPDFPSIKNKMMSLPVAQELVDDLCEGVDMCRDFSSCLPADKFRKYPVVKDMARTMVFFKCMKTAKLQACMKQDVRGYLSMMGLSDSYMSALGQEGDEDDVPGSVLGLVLGSAQAEEEMF